MGAVLSLDRKRLSPQKHIPFVVSQREYDEELQREVWWAHCPCGKRIARENRNGVVAGQFKCPKCGVVFEC